MSPAERGRQANLKIVPSERDADSPFSLFQQDARNLLSDPVGLYDSLDNARSILYRSGGARNPRTFSLIEFGESYRVNGLNRTLKEKGLGRSVQAEMDVVNANGKVIKKGVSCSIVGIYDVELGEEDSFLKGISAVYKDSEFFGFVPAKISSSGRVINDLDTSLIPDIPPTGVFSRRRIAV